MKSFKKLISLALSAVMLAAVIPTAAMAEETTKAVVEDLDWGNWLIPDQPWSSLYDGSALYVNNASGGTQWWCSSAFGPGKMPIIINDNGSTADLSDGNAHVIAPQSAQRSSDGKAWGFKGTKFFTDLVNQSSFDAFWEFPEDKWLGVKDISAHKDTGYAVFTIDSVTGDAENAYLAIKAAPMEWDVEELVVRMLGKASVNASDTNAFPITKDRYPITPIANTDGNYQLFKDFYNTKIVGAKLTDYYNVKKGGKQTVAVPLSKFVNAPDFMEVYGPSTDDEQFKIRMDAALDLRLFGGMGIARKDSGKQQAFTANISDLAIVDPKVPQNVVVEEDGENVYVFFERTTDSDVSYKVKKTYNGIVEYIDASEGLVEDTIDPTKSYVYQVVAIDNTYGIEAASEAYFVGDKGVEILKAEMNWRDYVGTNMDQVSGDFWKNYMEGENYYVGTIPGYNNYSGFEYCVGDNFKVYIDDHDAATKHSIAEEIYKVSGVPGSDPVEIPNVDGFWGYQGMGYGNLGQYVTNYPGTTKVPDDVWFGIKNIKDWEDTGYAVFTVNGVSGDADNAYLAITTLTDQWQLGQWAWDDTFPITKEGNENEAWVEHGMSIVTGAKLTDYYDVEKGGVQTVAVPLSKLVNNPDFREIRSKDYNSLTSLMGRQDFEYVKSNLYLFNGMGVARRDSGADKTFAATISEMKIVALQAPTNLVGKKNSDGSVSFTFNTTSDVGVSFKIARTVDGVTEYFDAPGGVYTDKNLNPRKSYTYKAVSYDAEDGIYSVGSNEVSIKPSMTKANMNWKDYTGINGNEWQNYMEGESYQIGDLSEYNNHIGYMYCGAADLVVTLNDNLAPAETNWDGKLVNRGISHEINTKWYTDESGNTTTAYEPGEIPNVDGFWGYQGMNYNYLKDYYDMTKVPDDVWFGVKNIKEYENSGCAVFTIESVDGDAENAYLAITTLPHLSDIPAFALDKEATLPITKEGNEDKVWYDEHYRTVVSGAKLTDYYDVAKGGKQTVAVPLSKFVNDPDLEEFRIKDYDKLKAFVEDKEALAEFKPELQLFTGMGIARRDSGAEETFHATVSEMKIVAVDKPENLKAEVNADGSVALSFDYTAYEGVTHKVKRVNGSEVVYFNAPNGVYTDSTRDEAKTYTYSAVAESETFGLVAESDSVTIEGIMPSSFIVLNVGEGEDKVPTKYVAAGTMSADFYADKDATGYIARYNANGKLLGANLVAVPAEQEVSVSLANVALTDTVKVMLWANYEAICEPIVATEKPVKVLYIGDETIVDAAQYIDDIAAADGVAYDVYCMSQEDASIAYSATSGLEPIKAVLDSDEWDYILVQEDMDTVLDGTAYTGFETLYNALSAEEGAEIIVVDGWGYSADVAPDGDSESMYIYVLSAADVTTDYASTISTSSAIYMIDMEGVAPWAADGIGLNESGAYATGLLIYKTISGSDIAENTFAPNGVETEGIKAIVAGL